jgi:hypothetical protein
MLCPLDDLTKSLDSPTEGKLPVLPRVKSFLEPLNEGALDESSN